MRWVRDSIRWGKELGGFADGRIPDMSISGPTVNGRVLSQIDVDRLELLGGRNLRSIHALRYGVWPPASSVCASIVCSAGNQPEQLVGSVDDCIGGGGFEFLSRAEAPSHTDRLDVARTPGLYVLSPVTDHEDLPL